MYLIHRNWQSRALQLQDQQVSLQFVEAQCQLFVFDAEEESIISFFQKKLKNFVSSIGRLSLVFHLKISHLAVLLNVIEMLFELLNESLEFENYYLTNVSFPKLVEL